MRYFKPDGTEVTEFKHKICMGEANYTRKPEVLRVYEEDCGDDWPWHLDGFDSNGLYTEDVRRYKSEEEAISHIPDFVKENDDLEWVKS